VEKWDGLPYFAKQNEGVPPSPSGRGVQSGNFLLRCEDKPFFLSKNLKIKTKSSLLKLR
jgi:hypothetical protein